MKLGLWRARAFVDGVRVDGSWEGYDLAARKHLGRFRMEHAARTALPPWRVAPPQDAAEIHYLTGFAHWSLTVFGIYSLLLHSRVPIRPVIHDDGSLEPEIVDLILRVLPHARIVRERDALEPLQAFLPPDKFPTLWSIRAKFPLHRKIMDAHASSPGWKLFLDSDMFFYQSPEFLLDWLRSPGPACCMYDIQSAYGYSPDLLRSLADAPLPRLVNTGICGLDRDAVDWQRLEHATRTLVEREGLLFYLEQALIAILFAGMPHQFAPREDYILCPIKDLVIPRPIGVMHHYVADSKRYMYIHAWKHVMRQVS
jgi:hypothetical protein